jgi:CrcB protein
MNEKDDPQARPSLSELVFRIVRHRMFLVMLGGALGTLARYQLGRWFGQQAWVERSGFPVGTFVINITGSFILGAASVFFQEKFQQYLEWFPFVGVGLCGGYTTFSTFEYETYRLVQDRSYGLALAYVFGSVIAGFIGVLAGVLLVRLLFSR